MSVAISTRVRGRTRTRCFERFGFLLGDRGDVSAQVRSNDFETSLRVAAEMARVAGRRPTQPGRPVATPVLPRTALVLVDPFGQRGRAAQLAIDGATAELSRCLGRPQIDDDGTVLGDDDVGGPQRRGGRCRRRAGRLPRHTASSRSGPKPSGRNRRVDGLTRPRWPRPSTRPGREASTGPGSGRPPGERAAGSDLSCSAWRSRDDPGHSSPACAAMPSGNTIQQVGVSAVAGVDLDEEAQGGRRPAGNGTAGPGRRRRARGELGQVESARRRASATVAALGRRFGAPTATSTAAPTRPHRYGQERLGQAGGTAITRVTTRDSSARSAARRHATDIGLATAVAAAAAAT